MHRSVLASTKVSIIIGYIGLKRTHRHHSYHHYFVAVIQENHLRLLCQRYEIDMTWRKKIGRRLTWWLWATKMYTFVINVLSHIYFYYCHYYCYYFNAGLTLALAYSDLLSLSFCLSSDEKNWIFLSLSYWEEKGKHKKTRTGGPNGYPMGGGPVADPRGLWGCWWEHQMGSGYETW